MIENRRLKLNENTFIENATQRTITIIGGKGTGKTTLIKMLIDQEKSVLAFDPLNVIKGDIDAYRIKIAKLDNEERIRKIAKIINTFLKEKKNIVVYFSEMLRDEIKEKMNILFPLLQYKNGFLFLDEAHEFCPLFSPSQEVERAIRHWRNRNIGVVMSTQRPAMMDTNTIGLTDFLVLFRVTWKNDMEAIDKILRYAIKEKSKRETLLGELQHKKFMEGYAIDFQK